MAVREWSTRFFTDEAIPVTKSVAVWKGTWTGKGTVIWASGITSNALNPELKLATLPQPEPIDKAFTAQDQQLGWTLFAPSAIVAKDAASPPPAIIPTTLLLGRSDEEIGYGLRSFFESAGTGVLLCLSGREGRDTGGRWNVGITQAMIEKIFRDAGLVGKPEVRVLAGYSTGYGVVQTINNALVPLAPVTRLVLFDCIYRTDRPKLPKGVLPPTLLPGDKPEFGAPAAPLRLLDETHGSFKPDPFNARRAIAKLTTAAPSARVVAYSTTSSGSPRYAFWDARTDATGKTTLVQVRLGSRPVVEIPLLAELRDQHKLTSGWSPSSAFDMLVLSRYLQLGAAAGLVSSTELGRVPFLRAAISSGLPPRGTVFATTGTGAVAKAPAGSKTIDLLAWAATLSGVMPQAQRGIAASIVRDHNLVLPGWDYEPNDLDEFRHAASLSEFGWEFLPP
jgi:hypothetical protein